MKENEKEVVGENNVANWNAVLYLIGDILKNQENQTVASEMIAEMKKESKRKDYGMVAFGAICGVAIIGLLFVNASHAKANERNNQRWLEYLSQYDFVSQDGEGYNYYNSDVGGDVVNGTENPKETK